LNRTVDLDAYLSHLRAEFARFTIAQKSESRLCRLIDIALRVLTLGHQRAFMTRYVTTLGSTVYVPSEWAARDPTDQYITMRHEAVHLRQFRRYTFLGMALIYLVPILPMGLAWGRARLEWEAYAETLQAVAEVRGAEAAMDPALHKHIVTQFVSGAYGWMWPFPRAIRRWIEETTSQLPR